MVHEQIVRDRELESRPARPFRQIVIIEEPQSKPFISPPIAS